MITRTPYKLTTGLARLQNSKPLEPVQTYDTQDKIDRCLSCTIPPEKCGGLCEGAPRMGGAQGRPMLAPVERVARMVRDGWADDAICHELGITPSTLKRKKSQCREQGLLHSCRKGERNS